MIAGKLIGLMINGVFVSCETQCQINFSSDMIKASAVDSARWAEFVAGLRSWSIAVNGNLLLEAVGSDIKAIITSGYIQGLPLYLQFSTMPSVDIQVSFSGAAILNTGSITAASKGAANWTATFQGTGALKTAYTNYGLLIDSMPAEADYPTIVDTQFTT
jgi:predicted secreted protein